MGGLKKVGGSYYDIRPVVLKGDRNTGSVQRYHESMSQVVQRCRSGFPAGVCMVTSKSTLPYKKAVETIAVAFTREMGYDFRPFSASEYSNRIYRRPDARTTDENTRSFLWFNEKEGYRGHWETFGGCTFRLMGDIWMLMWIWIHPYERRKGHLSAAWPFFQSMFGIVVPDPPMSPELLSFLKKVGHDKLLKKLGKAMNEKREKQ